MFAQVAVPPATEDTAGAFLGPWRKMSMDGLPTVGWTTMKKSLGRTPTRHKCQVIALRLMRPDDMFEMPQTDVFSEYRNFLTGVDFCMSELRGSLSRRPVRLEIHLPPEEINDGLAERLARTLRRYCNHRIRYNRSETRALRVGGISALRIGVPVSALGLVLTAVATAIRPSGGAANVVTDHVGWVLAWIGLWFPLDEFLFYPLAYGRESRVLHLLSDATVVLSPISPTLVPRGGLRVRRGQARKMMQSRMAVWWSSQLSGMIVSGVKFRPLCSRFRSGICPPMMGPIPGSGLGMVGLAGPVPLGRPPGHADRQR